MLEAILLLFVVCLLCFMVGFQTGTEFKSIKDLLKGEGKPTKVKEKKDG